MVLVLWQWNRLDDHKNRALGPHIWIWVLRVSLQATPLFRIYQTPQLRSFPDLKHDIQRSWHPTPLPWHLKEFSPIRDRKRHYRLILKLMEHLQEIVLQ